MVKKGKSRKSRNMGKSTNRKGHKLAVRAQFEARHIDQVWQDVRKAEGVTDGKIGPLGTTDRCKTRTPWACTVFRSVRLVGELCTAVGVLTCP